jgi:hypothetical protein
VTNTVRRVVSGGQTGVDRAALDFAIEQHLDFGGFVPLGRLDELGVIPERYTRLTEAPSRLRAVRTTMNVCRSDGTALFYRGRAKGGTALTKALAEALNRPFVHIDLARTPAEGAAVLVEWIEQHRIAVMNVAGPPQSKDQRAYSDTLTVLRLALSAQK